MAADAHRDRTPAPRTRTAVVTGASGGIGYEIARKLVQHGYRVWAVARPTERLRTAVDRLKEEANAGDDVVAAPADLSELPAVRRLARELRVELPYLDLLVNNAGVFLARRELTVDGFERTWALDHLSPFLLTHLLMDTLMKTPQPRVITTSSGAERVGEIDLARAATGVPFSGWRAYGWAKQANIHFARELVMRAPDPKLRSYAFHPGFTATGFGKGAGVLGTMIGLAARGFGRSATEGASTGVYLALEEPAPEPNGGYFMDHEPRRPSAAARDATMTLRLWEQSEEWVELTRNERLPRREHADGATSVRG